MDLLSFVPLTDESASNWTTRWIHYLFFFSYQMDPLPGIPLRDGSATKSTSTNCFPLDPLPGIPLRDESATNSTATRWIHFQMYCKMDPLPCSSAWCIHHQLYPYQMEPLPVVLLPDGSAATWIRYPVDLLSIVPLQGGYVTMVVSLQNISATNCLATATGCLANSYTTITHCTIHALTWEVGLSASPYLTWHCY